jgi:riboflavin synthase
MFTGLVERTARVSRVEPDGDGVRLEVETPLAAEGDPVNVELPLRAGDRLGGHMVQGHVDGTGTVASVADEGFARLVRIDAPAELLRYVVEKGSIAVDGVSLTVAEVDDASFTVSLIPETLERTTLGLAAPGRVVNLEVDVLAKYVEKLVTR